MAPVGGALLNLVIALLGSLSFGGAVGEIRQLWSILTNRFVSYSAEATLGGRDIRVTFCFCGRHVLCWLGQGVRRADQALTDPPAGA